MEDLEEVTVRPDSHYRHSTESRAGQCLVIGAVTLGLISGLCAGGLLGVMIDEALTHVKNLTSVRAEYRDWNIITIQFTTLSFVIDIISSHVGIALGYGAYSFLISIKGPQARATALAGAAPAALLGITAWGAAMGALCSKGVLEYELFSTAFLTYIFSYFFILYLMVFLLLFYRDERIMWSAVLALGISITGIALYAGFFGNYVLFPGMYIYLFVMFILLYVCYVYGVFPDYSENLSFVSTVCPTLLLLFTLLFFVGTGTGTQSAEEKGLVIVVLATQLLEAAVGHLVHFLIGGEGGMGAGKVCAGAVAAGGVVLVTIQKASPMLNTGARLWGLIGVSGAAGVALSAAGALGQRYGEAATRVWGGKLGRTATVLGAAAGAFLSGGTSDVRFGLFKAVCAAVIPGMPFGEFLWNVFYRGLHCVYKRTVMNFQHVDELL